MQGRSIEPIIITAKKPMHPKNERKTTFRYAPETKYDHLFKFQLKGDFGVGKSSLLQRFSEDTFREKHKSTIGVDFKMMPLTIENSQIKAQIWDCSGEERFSSYPDVIHGVHVLILVFNLTDLSSLYGTTALLNEHREKNFNSNVILVGTQSDRGNERVIQAADVAAFMEKSQHFIDAYIEASAKTGENVTPIFETAAQLALNRVTPPVRKQSIEEDEHPEEDENSPRMQLISHLKKYITRIQSHPRAQNKNKPDFSYGFCFFKNSRAINRRANYLLAQSLLRQLTTTDDSIETIFHDLDNKRQHLIQQKGLNTLVDYCERGINSNELNAIIKNAANFTETAKKSQQEERPLLSVRSRAF